MVSSSMAYECRIYDKKGKLVRVVSGKKIDSKSDQILFNQPSTKKAIALIRTFKDPKIESANNTKFYNKKCTLGAPMLNIVRMNVRRHCNWRTEREG